MRLPFKVACDAAGMQNANELEYDHSELNSADGIALGKKIAEVGPLKKLKYTSSHIIFWGTSASWFGQGLANKPAAAQKHCGTIGSRVLGSKAAETFDSELVSNSRSSISRIIT